MKILFISLLPLLALSIDFDESILQELEQVSSKVIKDRNCASNGFKLNIKENSGNSTREINISSSNDKFSKSRKYYVYDESADFILADNLNLTDLAHAKKDFTPELIIVKKGSKALIIEGLGSKFVKNDNYSVCEQGSKSIHNLRCNFRSKKGRLENYKNLQSFNNYFSFQQNLKTLAAPSVVRDVASLIPNHDLELKFISNHLPFHTPRVKVGIDSASKRTGVLINAQDVVSLTFSNPNASSVLENCNLTL